MMNILKFKHKPDKKLNGYNLQNNLKSQFALNCVSDTINKFAIN